MRITRAGAECIPSLEPLWNALHERHMAVAGQVAGMPARSVEEAWPLRRRKYESWLRDPGAFVMLAERDGRLIGYALVHLGAGPSSYEGSPLVGDVESLSVLPEARGEGVGGALMDAVERELADQGIPQVRLSVLAGNEDAMRFYRRRGMETFSHLLIGKVGSGE